MTPGGLRQVSLARRGAKGRRHCIFCVLHLHCGGRVLLTLTSVPPLPLPAHTQLAAYTLLTQLLLLRAAAHHRLSQFHTKNAAQQAAPGAFQLAYTLGLGVSLLTAWPVGIFLDRFGPRKCSIPFLLCSCTALLFLSFHWVIPAMKLMETASQGVMFGVVSLSALFPSASATVLAICSGFFQFSIAFWLISSQAYRAGAEFRLICRVMTVFDGFTANGSALCSAHSASAFCIHSRASHTPLWTPNKFYGCMGTWNGVITHNFGINVNVIWRMRNTAAAL